MTNPFDYVNSINNHEKKEVIDGYNKFLICRNFRYFIDTIMVATECARLNNNIDNSIHYDYLFNSIKPKKRFSKWHKLEKNDKIEIIMEYNNCSRQKAQEIYTLFSDNEEIMGEMETWYKNKKGENE